MNAQQPVEGQPLFATRVFDDKFGHGTAAVDAQRHDRGHAGLRSPLQGG